MCDVTVRFFPYDSKLRFTYFPVSRSMLQADPGGYIAARFGRSCLYFLLSATVTDDADAIHLVGFGKITPYLDLELGK